MTSHRHSPSQKGNVKILLTFFNDHPTVGNSYQFTNLLTGEIVTRTVTKRVKRSRYSDVFNCKQAYFEATLLDGNGKEFVTEYELTK